MNKDHIRHLIVERLDRDLRLLLKAAKAAHDAATHEETVPDNKYETLGLEASYIAQGQANRAQQIKDAVEAYKGLALKAFGEEDAIRLTALVTVEDEEGDLRTLFLGPEAGGLKLEGAEGEVTVITPSSPLGRELLGRRLGDLVEMRTATGIRALEIVELH